MADVEDAVVAILQTDAVAAIIGGRYYPVDLPQHPVWPAVTYMNVSTPRSYTMKGASGLLQSRIQFDCFAATYDEAVALKNAIRAAVGAVERQTVGGVLVHKVFVTMDRDASDSGQRKSGGRVRRRMLEATFTCRGN